jgi:Mce-associated membrane protein
VSKHSEDETAKEESTVQADTDTEQADEETAAEDSTEKAEESTETADESTEAADESSDSGEPEKPKRSIKWGRVFGFVVLPALALILAIAAGYLKWMDNSVRDSDVAGIESVQAAKDNTIAILSYKPDTVEQQLHAARDLLTGEFRDSYTSLTNDVVIPGAKQKQISAVATVPAAASVSAKSNHAVVLVFVNQTVVVGQDAPSDSASSVRVTLDKINGRWLIAKFDPV